jgi:hypothetical protein
VDTLKLWNVSLTSQFNLVNLLFSYFDTSVNPPRTLPPEIVFNKDDTISPLLSKVYTGRQRSSSTLQELGINPFPLSILSAQMTFLPLTNLHTERSWLPVSRFNVPLLRSDHTNDSQEETQHELKDSVAQVAGYIITADTWLALRPELVRVLQSEFRGEAYNELKRMERKSHQRWLGMENDGRERSGSIVSDYESVKKILSGESATSKSGVSERSMSSSMVGDPQATPTAPAHTPNNPVFDKVELRKEVGVWWGKKTAD